MDYSLDCLSCRIDYNLILSKWTSSYWLFLSECWVGCSFGGKIQKLSPRVGHFERKLKNLSLKEKSNRFRSRKRSVEPEPSLWTFSLVEMRGFFRFGRPSFFSRRGYGEILQGKRRLCPVTRVSLSFTGKRKFWKFESSSRREIFSICLLSQL